MFLMDYQKQKTLRSLEQPKKRNYKYVFNGV